MAASALVAGRNPMMRGLAEMAYEFEEPFVLDTSKYESTFGAAGTRLAPAINTTVAWYRNTATTPRQEAPTSSPAPEPTLPPANGSGARPSSKAAKPLRRSA